MVETSHPQNRIVGLIPFSGHTNGSLGNSPQKCHLSFLSLYSHIAPIILDLLSLTIFFLIRSHAMHHHFSPPFGEIRFSSFFLKQIQLYPIFCQNLDRPLSFPCDAAFPAGPLRFACGTMTWMSLGT